MLARRSHLNILFTIVLGGGYGRRCISGFLITIRWPAGFLPDRMDNQLSNPLQSSPHSDTNGPMRGFG